jgi:Pregnancy-associated plasma protein-A
MMQRFLSIQYLGFFIALLSGQSGSAQCLADELAARNAQRYPELARQREQLEQQMADAVHRRSFAAAERGIFTIQVVVHVVANTPSENLSDEQVRSQITILNQDFRQLNPDREKIPAEFAGVAADVGIEFCLATTDPRGNPTSGITRRQTSWPNIGNLETGDGRKRVCYNSLGGTDAWDSKRYLNIWVARLSNGLLGFATFPGSAPTGEDGVFVDPRYFGLSTSVPHNLGRTCTHEVGHYFNLRHIWGVGSGSCDDEDGVEDTPKQRDAFRGCPAFPQLSCGGRAMFMNFMDYTDDACMHLFTEGQKDRMLAALTVARKGLLAENSCNLTTSAHQIGQLGVMLFPNPATGELNVRLPVEATANPAEFAAIDALGRRVQLSITQVTDSAIQFDIGQLPAGPYVLTGMVNGLPLATYFVKH